MDGASRTESRTRPGRWNTTDRPNSGGASFSGAASRPDSRERPRDSRATSRPASREGRSAEAQEYSSSTAASHQARRNTGGSSSVHRREEEPAWAGGGSAAAVARDGGDYNRESGGNSNNAGGKTSDYGSWSKQHTRSEHGVNQHARNGPSLPGASSRDSEGRRWAQPHYHGRGSADGRGGGGRAGRGHWKARLPGGRGDGGSFATRDHADRGRGPGAGSDASWHASRDGGDGRDSSGPRQAGRDGEPMRNGGGSQGERGREGGTSSIHPAGNRLNSQGMNAGSGQSGFGADRRTREPGFRHGQAATASASVGNGGGRKEKDYSGLALPKPAAARSVASAPPAATSGTGYAALAASAEGAPSIAASVGRPARGRSHEYDRGQQQPRSMGRPTASSGGRSGSTNSFNPRGTYDTGSRGGKSFRQQGDGGGSGSSSSTRDFHGLANGSSSKGVGSSSTNGRQARSRSPPSRSARRTNSASPSARQQGYRRPVSGSGLDPYAPSGGGDDSDQRSGRPHVGFESSGRGEGGAGRKAWNARGEHHHSKHNNYGSSSMNGFGKDGDRFDGRPDSANNNRGTREAAWRPLSFLRADLC